MLKFLIDDANLGARFSLNQLEKIIFQNRGHSSHVFTILLTLDFINL